MKTNASLEQRRRAAISDGLSTGHRIYVDRAMNSELWDVEGKRYIDFAGGIGVLNVGHNHPEVVKAVAAQATRFLHTAFQVASYEPYIELAEILISHTPIEGEKKAVFLNSGAEAVENAIKIARYATSRPGVIAFTGGFHGRTLLTMGLTGKMDPYKSGFGPFPANLLYAEFPNEDTPNEIERALASIDLLFRRDIDASQVAAMIIEPVQGENGFRIAPIAFMQALRRICDKHGIVLIADEVQAGFARSGHWFSIEHSGVNPDLLVVAKSLGGGLPISGVVGRAALMDAVQPGGLGGTFAGNPLACVAGIAALRAIEAESLVERSLAIGERIRARFDNDQTRNELPNIGALRGLGGMIGLELLTVKGHAPATELTKTLIRTAREKGLLLITSGVYENIIRILVPLTVEDAVLDEGLEIFADALAQAAKLLGENS